MYQRFSPTLEETPDPQDIQFLEERLREYNLLYTKDYGFRPLAVFLRDADGQLLGGLSGATAWGWLHTDVLWIREDLRGSGHGESLLQRAEEEAKQRGCHGAYVETHNFQAPSFYEKQGYGLYGELRDFPKPHTKYYYWKALARKTTGDDTT